MKKKKKKKSHFPLQSSQTDDKFTNLVGLYKRMSGGFWVLAGSMADV